jgi:hypothetical protein
MPEDGLEAQSALQQPKSGSIYTALAQSATRTAALYFSRPVRLFRPSKRMSSALVAVDQSSDSKN